MLSVKKESTPTLNRYQRYLEATARWLLRSVEKGKGGSAAYFFPLTGWSHPYPETTGYIIPTLLKLKDWLPVLETDRVATVLGEWLLNIQQKEGFWDSGFHPPKKKHPSIFNTAQILKGMVALHDNTQDSRWLDAATQAAEWLAAGVTPEGVWRHIDYQAQVTPTYYAQAAWAMLEVYSRNGDDVIREGAEKVLSNVMSRQMENGAFDGWGFMEGQPCSTHTIAYTIRGLLESARLLDAWDSYGKAAIAALEVLLRRSELAGGRLPGAYDVKWRPIGKYVCLTGNAQIALCLLIWEEREMDLHLVNAAAKLVDAICDAQHVKSIVPGLRGAVAGSFPMWGRYMIFRYPNWAAKYHLDALMMLSSRIMKELD